MLNRLQIRRLLWAGALAVIAAGAVYLFVMDPHKPGRFPSCPFWSLTGFHCPGCGSLRALHCLMHGHVGAAASRNILALLLLPVAAYGAIIDFTEGRPIIMGRRSIKLPRLPSKTPLVLLAVIMAYWVIRNLPWYPFTLLAPQG